MEVEDKTTLVKTGTGTQQPKIFGTAGVVFSYKIPTFVTLGEFLGRALVFAKYFLEF